MSHNTRSTMKKKLAQEGNLADPRTSESGVSDRTGDEDAVDRGADDHQQPAQVEEVRANVAGAVESDPNAPGEADPGQAGTAAAAGAAAGASAQPVTLTAPTGSTTVTEPVASGSMGPPTHKSPRGKGQPAGKGKGKVPKLSDDQLHAVLQAKFGDVLPQGETWRNLFTVSADILARGPELPQRNSESDSSSSRSSRRRGKRNKNKKNKQDHAQKGDQPSAAAKAQQEAQRLRAQVSELQAKVAQEAQRRKTQDQDAALRRQQMELLNKLEDRMRTLEADQRILRQSNNTAQTLGAENSLDSTTPPEVATEPFTNSAGTSLEEIVDRLEERYNRNRNGRGTTAAPPPPFAPTASTGSSRSSRPTAVDSAQHPERVASLAQLPYGEASLRLKEQLYGERLTTITAEEEERSFQDRTQILRDDDNYYRGLPPPWRVPDRPMTPIASGADAKSKKLLFDGTLEAYPVWRSYFLYNFHLFDLPVGIKCQRLLECFDMGSDFLKSLRRRISPSAKGYADVLEQLEEEFGGHARMRAAMDQSLRDIPTYKSELDLEAHRELLLTAQAYVRNAQDFGMDITAESRMLLHTLMLKVPASLRRKYASYLAIHKLGNTLAAFLDFAREWKKQLRFALDIEPPKRKTNARVPNTAGAENWHGDAKNGASKGGKSTTLMAALDEDEEVDANYPGDPVEGPMAVFLAARGSLKDVCPFCDNKHRIRDCPLFIPKDAAQRRKMILDKNRCERCFGDHASRTCPSTRTCRQCDRFHHTFLHGSREKHAEYEKEYQAKKNTQSHVNSVTTSVGSGEETPTEETEDTATTTSFFCASKKRRSLRTLAVLLETPDGRESKANAVLDDGSMEEMLDANVAKRLRLKGFQTNFGVTGIGGVSRKYDRAVVTWVKVSSLDRSYSLVIPFIVIPNLTGGLKAVDWNKHKLEWDNLRDIQFPEVAEGPVEIIIGGGWPRLQDSLEERPGKGHQSPGARRTHLGWTAFGPVSPDYEPKLWDKDMDERQILLAHVEKQAVSYGQQLCQDDPLGIDVIHFGREEGADESGYVSGSSAASPVQEMEELRKTLPQLHEEETPGGSSDESCGLNDEHAAKILKQSRKKIIQITKPPLCLQTNRATERRKGITQPLPHVARQLTLSCSPFPFFPHCKKKISQQPRHDLAAPPLGRPPRRHPGPGAPQRGPGGPQPELPWELEPQTVHPGPSGLAGCAHPTALAEPREALRANIRAGDKHTNSRVGDKHADANVRRKGAHEREGFVIFEKEERELLLNVRDRDLQRRGRSGPSAQELVAWSDRLRGLQGLEGEEEDEAPAQRLQGPRRLAQHAGQARQEKAPEKKTRQEGKRRSRVNFPALFSFCPSNTYPENTYPEKRNFYLPFPYILNPKPILTFPFSTFLQTINMLKSMSLDRITQGEGLLTRVQARMVFCVAPEWPCAVMTYEVMKREKLACYGPVWEHETIYSRLATPGVIQAETQTRAGQGVTPTPTFVGSPSDFYLPDGGHYERGKRAFFGYLTKATDMGAQSLQNRFCHEVGVSAHGDFPPPSMAPVVTLEAAARNAWDYGLGMWPSYPEGRVKLRFGHMKYTQALYDPALPFWAHSPQLECNDGFILEDLIVVDPSSKDLSPMTSASP